MARIDRCKLAAFALAVVAFWTFWGVPGAGAEEPVSYDVTGRWLMEGEGYGDKNSVRLQLKLDGILDFRTDDIEGRRCITGYDLWIRIDTSRMNVKTWQETYREQLRIPLPLPELRPTLNSPLILPTVKTRDGLIYQVTLTSVTSGTVKIYGNIDIDVLGKTEINSESALWKEGSQKPEVEDLSSGCGVGLGAGPLLLLLPLLLGRARRR